MVSCTASVLAGISYIALLVIVIAVSVYLHGKRKP